MKNFKTLSLLALFLIVGLFSCQKPIIFVEGSGPGGGNVPGTTPGNGTVYMKGKVNGVMVECTSVTAAVMPITSTETTIQIMGFKGNQGFNIMLNNYKGVGTYDLFVDVGTYIGNIMDPNTAYFSEQGTVKITEATDKYVKGTFEFKGINGDGETTTITEGQFMSTVVSTGDPGQGADNSRISVKIDGTQTTFDDCQIVSPGALNIIGAAGLRSITLSVVDFNGKGTYDVTGKINEGAYLSYTIDANTTYREISGKITFTEENDDGLVGTFEGVLKLENSSKLITMTEGKFNVKY